MFQYPYGWPPYGGMGGGNSYPVFIPVPSNNKRGGKRNRNKGSKAPDPWTLFTRFQRWEEVKEEKKKKADEEKKKNDKPKTISFNILETTAILIMFGPFVGWAMKNLWQAMHIIP